VQWGGFMVHVDIYFINFLWLPLDFLHSKLEFHLHFTSISIVTFQILLMFPFLQSIEVQWWGMGGHAHLQSRKKLCITSSCNNQEITTLVYTQQRLTSMFVLSNNVHYTYNTCKVFHLVMDSIGMNCCWGRPEGLLIVLNLWRMWQITHLSHCS